MKLYHITPKGNLHFQLADGRLAAVYPETGYVRVSASMNNFRRHEYKVKTLARYNKVVEDKNPGKVIMWQINRRVPTTTKHPVNRELFYENGGRMYKYHHEVFFEYTSNTCETYPNQITKLMDLLVAFEKKNCIPGGSIVLNGVRSMDASLYNRLADKFDNITINKWPC